MSSNQLFKQLAAGFIGASAIVFIQQR